MERKKKKRRRREWVRAEEHAWEEAPSMCGCMDCRPLRPLPPDAPRVYIKPPAVYFTTGESVHE